MNSSEDPTAAELTEGLEGSYGTQQNHDDLVQRQRMTFVGAENEKKIVSISQLLKYPLG